MGDFDEMCCVACLPFYKLVSARLFKQLYICSSNNISTIYIRIRILSCCRYRSPRCETKWRIDELICSHVQYTSTVVPYMSDLADAGRVRRGGSVVVAERGRAHLVPARVDPPVRRGDVLLGLLRGLLPDLPQVLELVRRFRGHYDHVQRGHLQQLRRVFQ